MRKVLRGKYAKSPRLFVQHDASCIRVCPISVPLLFTPQLDMKNTGSPEETYFHRSENSKHNLNFAKFKLNLRKFKLNFAKFNLNFEFSPQ